MSFDELVARVDRAAQAAFGEPVPVVYAPEVGTPVDVTPTGQPLIGIFDLQYVLAKGSAQAGVETRGPAVFIRLEDLPTDPEDDEPTLTIRAVNYRVVERRPDGLGGIVLVLRQVT